jgi:glutamate 5-kinase
MHNDSPKKIVVKIGSRVLSSPDGGIDDIFLNEFVDSIANLHHAGYLITLVSSGAIRLGAPKLDLEWNNMDITQKQTAAAVGQGILISRYIELFAKRDIIVGQVLLTPDITNFRKKYLNARNTLRSLLKNRCIPIVNENDTVSSEEIKFGDNDTLSAITAILLGADLLVLLSDVDGVYNGDPRSDKDAKKISEITEITANIETAATGPTEDGGFGGMTTKIDAAKSAIESGIRMVIAHGREERVLERIVNGEKVGTTFIPKESSLSARKKWLAFGCQTEGRIVVNHGARNAIISKGTSLLPSGIVGTAGTYDQGACVEICTPDDVCFAKGLTNYSTQELEKIKGRQSNEIRKILNFKIADEAVHRDDMALLVCNVPE